MNIKRNIKSLPVLTAAMGILTLLARTALFVLGRDEKGLLVSGHPMNLLAWLLTAAAAALILWKILPLDGSRAYGDNFSPSTAAAIGAFALAGGILVCVLTGWSALSILDLIRNLLGLAAVPALVLLGLRRWQGKRPPVFLHAAVCLYLTLYAVTHYQTWSSRPQLQEWFFAMAATLVLTVFSYYQAAFDADMGSRRKQLASGLLAGFFCIAAMAGGEDIPLYFGGAVWALTNLCSLTPVSRPRRNPITQSREEPGDASA